MTGHVMQHSITVASAVSSHIMWISISVSHDRLHVLQHSMTKSVPSLLYFLCAAFPSMLHKIEFDISHLNIWGGGEVVDIATSCIHLPAYCSFHLLKGPLLLLQFVVLPQWSATCYPSLPSSWNINTDSTLGLRTVNRGPSDWRPDPKCHGKAFGVGLSRMRFKGWGVSMHRL